MSRWFAGLLCSAHMQAHIHTHTHAHANTHIHMHARSCHLSFILHLSFPLHIPRQDNATRWIVRDVCVWVYVCVRETERDTRECERVVRCWMKSQTFLVKTASEVVIWKADDSFIHSFMWIIAIHLSAILYSGRIAYNRGIVFVLHHSLSACVQEMAHCTFRQGYMSKAWLSAKIPFLFGTTNGFRAMRNVLFGILENLIFLLSRVPEYVFKATASKVSKLPAPLICNAS